MALDNIPTLGPGAFNSNLDKVLIYKKGGSEVAASLLTLTNSALNLSGIYLDTVNQRVGIGNPNPTSTLDVNGTINGFTFSGSSGDRRIYTNSNYFFIQDNSGTVFQMQGGKFSTSQFDGTAKFNIRGTGSTSATTSLLVQNSGGTTALSVRDDLYVSTGGGLSVAGSISLGTNQGIGDGNFSVNVNRLESYNNYTIRTLVQNRYIFLSPGNTEILYANYWAGGNLAGVVVQDTGGTPLSTSAVLQANSTTRGFLPPRLTTAQKNAIATPAVGLMVYDTDLNRPCFYSGSAWTTL